MVIMIWTLYNVNYLPHRKYECWIEGQWTFSDPWGCPLRRAVDPPKPLSCFSITDVIHATHKTHSEGILERGLEARQLEINPHDQVPKFTWSGERKDLPRQLCQTLCLPGYYVWFAPEVTLTKAQRATCWKMITENGVAQFADYIEDHSRYGSQAFSLSLSDAILLYKHSLKKYYETSLGRPASTLDVLFKRAGTKRYQCFVGYILVICAKVEGQDPLPQFPNADPPLDNDPITVLDTSELRFRPKGIALKQGEDWPWCSWDQPEIAFHFPSIPEYPNTPHHSLPGDKRSVLLISLATPFYHSLAPQNTGSLQCCIAVSLSSNPHKIHGYTYMALSQVYHTFCVPSLPNTFQCPEKNEEELIEHQKKRFLQV